MKQNTKSFLCSLNIHRIQRRDVLRTFNTHLHGLPNALKSLAFQSRPHHTYGSPWHSNIPCIQKDIADTRWSHRCATNTYFSPALPLIFQRSLPTLFPKINLTAYSRIPFQTNLHERAGGMQNSSSGLVSVFTSNGKHNSAITQLYLVILYL